MNPSLRIAAILFSVCLVSLGCDSDSSSPDQPQWGRFLGHDNRGCIARGDSVEECPGAAHLKSFEFNRDTLRLSIHFHANCCPGFVESSVLGDHRISLELADTLYDCKCICPFDNEFGFLWKQVGDVEISFRSTTPRGSCDCALDTLITLKR